MLLQWRTGAALRFPKGLCGPFLSYDFKQSFPLKTPFSGADFEVAFGDAEVDGGVAGEDGEAFLRLHFVAVVEDEGELLLVDGGGG